MRRRCKISTRNRISRKSSLIKGKIMIFWRLMMMGSLSILRLLKKTTSFPKSKGRRKNTKTQPRKTSKKLFLKERLSRRGLPLSLTTKMTPKLTLISKKGRNS
jgi:hypothetical protein